MQTPAELWVSIALQVKCLWSYDYAMCMWQYEL